jgi:hypothetical protein
MGEAPWPTARRARTRSIIHQTLNVFFVRDIGYERNKFCPPAATETDEWRPVTASRLGRSLVMVRVTSSGSPAMLKTPMWAMDLG